ncbi:Cysteine-rich secretory protein family protein [Ruegeria denitrificans]|uniref:Cysteine-rich secretory protein family protein n=1 Tax=Ruegeria denitrificans TaxID=1715692 RepID=A0A0P1I9U3_9RHOB|nr:CAP domain-containing protein [Ruegeria denitrificans]CUK00234.1 Cysteine-rich secretory protein family protein [Ruegeria denitrificans]
MSTASTFEQEMLALINDERTSRGLNPLQLETRLNDSAEDHSTWMLNADIFSHTGSGGSSATERMQDAGFDFSGSWRSGENIAWQSERGTEGISDDVEQLHQSLMNSPGHRANILNPDYEYIGIGIEEGDYNGWDAVMVTQNFATTDAEVVLDNGAAPTPPTDEVAEPEDPVTEDPDTDVTETEDPVEETPGTDVTETEEPVDETPDTDVTETEEPDDETTDTDTVAGDCFNVEEFLAAIEDFVNDLLALVDDFRMNDNLVTDADNTAEDDFMLTLDMCDDTPSASEDSPVMEADAPDDFFVLMPVDNGCMMDFV